MKINLGKFMLLATLTCLSLSSAWADRTQIKILGEREMASIQGGLCVFSKCQTGAPSGNCQPIPATYAAVCSRGTCTLSVEEIGPIEAVSCILKGKYTCSLPGAYRKCVSGKISDLCWNSDISVCGTLVEPSCYIDMKSRTCNCAMDILEGPCDWTNCLLESQ